MTPRAAAGPRPAGWYAACKTRYDVSIAAGARRARGIDVRTGSQRAGPVPARGDVDLQRGHVRGPVGRRRGHRHGGRRGRPGPAHHRDQPRPGGAERFGGHGSGGLLRGGRGRGPVARQTGPGHPLGPEQPVALCRHARGGLRGHRAGALRGHRRRDLPRGAERPVARRHRLRADRGGGRGQQVEEVRVLRTASWAARRGRRSRSRPIAGSSRLRPVPRRACPGPWSAWPWRPPGRWRWARSRR